MEYNDEMKYYFCNVKFENKFFFENINPCIFK